MSGKFCLVTGTSSGIGQALAEQLLADGWHVLGIARRAAPIEHERYTHHSLDLSDLAAVEAWVAGDFARTHDLDGYARVGLVNNAALLEPVVPYSQVELSALARAYHVNSVVPVWLSAHFVRACKRPALRIVDISSGAAVRATPGWTAYCSTKGALLMAGKVLGTEVEQNPEGLGAPADFGLLSYAPGIVDTGMQAQIRTHSAEEFPSIERFRGFHAEGQLAPPAGPAAEVVAFLNRDRVPAFSEARYGG